MNNSEKTKLERKFGFWYRISDDALLHSKTLDKKEYETQVKKIADFETIEDFWGIFQHLRKPDSCKSGVEFQMFKDPIKPMWEDEGNKSGGKISIKLKKDYTTIIWEELILALIGGVLPNNVKEEISGIVISVRKEFNILQIWFGNYQNNVITDIENSIKELLQIPDGVELETKQFFRTGGYNTNKEQTAGPNIQKRKL